MSNTTVPKLLGLAFIIASPFAAHAHDEDAEDARDRQEDALEWQQDHADGGVEHRHRFRNWVEHAGDKVRHGAEKVEEKVRHGAARVKEHIDPDYPEQ